MLTGLLGRKLAHSYSPKIHSMLGDYEYRLFEVEPEELGAFMKSGGFDAVNVTIPYKRDVIRYCSRLSGIAAEIGSVNTVVRLASGELYGDNTDIDGFSGMLRRLGVSVSGKKALVLGSGGASQTVRYVLEREGADAVVIYCGGENNYGNIERHCDAKLIVNCTPVGMYPDNGAAPLDIERFDALEGVLDLIYNPARTKLLLDAHSRSIPYVDGLYMLVEQARRASELFTGTSICPEKTDEIYKVMHRDMQNIVLIGMPGCGKTCVGRKLAEITGREFVDSDEALEEMAGESISAYFASHSVSEFRHAETEVLKGLGKKSGVVLATGGGCVTIKENMPILKQNGRLIWLKRPLDELSAKGRPLSKSMKLTDMYKEREGMYAAFADACADNDSSVGEAARRILEAYNEISDT